MRQASVAVDLGAESCRVSLLRWQGEAPYVHLVHRFANGPITVADGTLRWPMTQIVEGVEHGLRLCAKLAIEGIVSVGVDGWAVDYVRVGLDGEPLEEPFCYRDERTVTAAAWVHERISAQRLRDITGLQQKPLNTLYQLVADDMAGARLACAGSICRSTSSNAGRVRPWRNTPTRRIRRWSTLPRDHGQTKFSKP